MDANRTAPRYELKDELARLCLSSAGRDTTNRKLAWANSVCILFLLIGLLGARRGVISIKPVPPIRVEVPVVVVPTVLPPQAVAPKPEQAQPPSQSPVVVVLPNAPGITFSVPTVGTLVAPASLAPAPQVQPVPVRIASISNTGSGGERPEPPYPKLALDAGQQGTVVLSITGDDSGNVVSVDVKTSSGSAILDRATVDYVKRHWRLPAGGARQFETSVTYKLYLQ
jgi:TonB family protein